MFRMRLCQVCGSYTLLEAHHGKQTISAHPPKFNPNDPYGEYRRRARFANP